MLIEISNGGSIYSMKISKYYKLRFSFFRELVVKNLFGYYWVLGVLGYELVI